MKNHFLHCSILCSLTMTYLHTIPTVEANPVPLLFEQVDKQGRVNTKAIAMLKEKKGYKHFKAKIVELKDNAGLVYLGAIVSKAQLHQYLAHFKEVDL